MATRAEVLRDIKSRDSVYKDDFAAILDYVDQEAAGASLPAAHAQILGVTGSTMTNLTSAAQLLSITGAVIEDANGLVTASLASCQITINPLSLPAGDGLYEITVSWNGAVSAGAGSTLALELSTGFTTLATMGGSDAADQQSATYWLRVSGVGVGMILKATSDSDSLIVIPNLNAFTVKRIAA